MASSTYNPVLFTPIIVPSPCTPVFEIAPFTTTETVPADADQLSGISFSKSIKTL